MNQADKDENKYNRLWKMRTFSYQLNDTYAKFYSPCEHLAMDEVIKLLKGRIIFKQYICKKGKHFGIHVYKLHDLTGYTYEHG